MHSAQCNRHTGNLHWDVMRLNCDIITIAGEFPFHLGCLPAAWREIKEEAALRKIKIEVGTGIDWGKVKQIHHIRHHY